MTTCQGPKVITQTAGSFLSPALYCFCSNHCGNKCYEESFKHHIEGKMKYDHEEPLLVHKCSAEL